MAHPNRDTRADSDTRHALLVIAAGVVAALHVGKLPPALDVLRADFGLGLAEAGLLLSMIQIAGMTVGVLLGAWVDAIGSSRGLRFGLVLLAFASVAGAFSTSAAALLAWRAVEGVGFLFSVLAAPPLIRALVGASRLRQLMGLWGTYMPLGFALALVGGPAVIALSGWRGWWVVVGAATAVAAGVVTWLIPADRVNVRTSAVPVAARSSEPGGEPDRGPRFRPDGEPAGERERADGASALRGATASTGLVPRLRETLGHRGPWLVALCFAVYSAQWLAVVGFLPLVVAQFGVAPAMAGVLTAIVSLANAAGNMLGAGLLHRGHRATRLIAAGFTFMAIGSFATYAQVGGEPDIARVLAHDRFLSIEMAARYAAMVAFSFVGGLIPASLFALAALMAPSERTLGSTVGWMQQWSALGQFAGPPLAGWMAGAVGGWQFTWVMTAGLSAAGLGLAALTARHPRVRAATADARRR